MSSDRLAMLKLDRETLESCIHCGLCLPACPTYQVTGRETESPRGRIYAVARWYEGGGVELDARTAEHLDSCLGCLGCQTACPSGVHYERILEGVRPLLADRRGFFKRFLMRFSFSKILPSDFLLLLAGSLLRLVQILRVDRLPLLNLFPRLVDWRRFTPRVPAHRKLPRHLQAKGSQTDRGAPVVFFKGCVMDVFYNDVNNAAMRVLSDTGRDCTLPEQTCCGALALHAGDVDIALSLARRNIECFSGSTGDIVVTSAGCGAILKDYGHLLEHDSNWSARAAEFSKRVKDFSEAVDPFVLKRKLDASKNHLNKKEKVAYHAACHLAHAQGVRAAPRALLEVLVENGVIESVALEQSEHCCGSAGIYNLLNTELSLGVLDEKMRNVRESQADCVVTSNPGCLLQLEAGVEREKLDTRVRHMAQLLDDALRL